MSRLQYGVLALALPLHRRLRTTMARLPREEQYPVKSIINDGTTCRGVRLAPSRSRSYFSIWHSNPHILRTTPHRDIAVIVCSRIFISLIFCSDQKQYINGAGDSRDDVQAGSRGGSEEEARTSGGSGWHGVVEATEGGAATSKAP